MKNFFLKIFLKTFKSKTVIAVTGSVILLTTVLGSIYFAKTNVEAETIIAESTTTPETEAETTPTIEDIGVSDSKEAAFENVNGTYYAELLGVTIAIPSTAIPEGTVLAIKTYDMATSPVGQMIKGNEKALNIFSLYNFELLCNGEVITVAEGTTITVTLAVPEGSSEFLSLCNINYETATFEYYKGTVKDGFISFNLNHFSFYSLIEMTEENYYGQFGMPVVQETATKQNDMGDAGTVSTAAPAAIVEPELLEVSGMVYGIDVSRWQGTINWSQVKASGIKFVIIKACGVEYGDGLYIDRNFKKNIEGALAVGLQVGVYAYSDMPTEADTLNLANQIIDLVKGYKITYPIVFDFESSAWPVTKTELTNLAILFCDTVKAAGYTPMVYANPNYLKNYYNADTLTSKYKLWLAVYYQPQYYGSTYDGHWYASDIYPQVNYPFQMWQYTSQGSVPGISGRVDMNVAFFSYSGTSVSTSELKLDVANTTVTTNSDTSPNLLNGVTATNTIGIDVSSSVTYKITNASSTEVTLADAIKTAGTYTIEYTIVDFTGGKLSKTATLIVRGRPVITGIQASYNLADTLSESDIKTALLAGVSATSYEGTALTSSIQVTGIPNPIVAGTYTISYTVTDSNGLTSQPQTVQLTLTHDETT